MVAIYYLADNLRIILNGATENLLSMRVRGNGDSSIPVAGIEKLSEILVDIGNLRVFLY